MRERFSSLARWKQIGIVAGSAAVVVVAVVAIWAISFFRTDDPETYASDVEHFLYGSIGSEADGGIPYWVWRVLPDLFEEHLPVGLGDGYERFGFIYEEGRDRPIGTSLRDRPFPMIAVNCAACHVGTVRAAPDVPQEIMIGMPAQQLDFLAYQRFLIDAAEDERFTAGNIIAAIEEINPDFGWLESQMYRHIVIPRVQDEILARADEFDFLNDRPDWGPGRVDTFSPYKVHFDFDMEQDDTIGVADLPSLWNQGVREDMYLHWDGNNNSLRERNISAALGAGATEDSLDHDGIERVAAWIRDLPAPAFPEEHIDAELAAAGEPMYQQHCASCHALDGERVGQIEPLSEVGTSPERTNAFGEEIASYMNTYGEGYDWAFSHFQSTDGYSNPPLDGTWLRAPFLHNGSVPTLRDLLRPASERPEVFYRGYDEYDYENVGFVSDGPEAEEYGFRFDTAERGNSNQGHEYGTGLSDDEIDALIEYLKTK